MITGFLVRPDLTHNIVEFELDSAAQFLGGISQDRVAVAFQEDGSDYAALFNPDAKVRGAEPNPVASLGRNAAATGDASFFSDPTAAISGTVIFVGAEGEDISLDDIRRVKDGIRAVRNYQEDQPQEFQLWRAAVLNLGEFTVD